MLVAGDLFEGPRKHDCLPFIFFVSVFSFDFLDFFALKRATYGWVFRHQGLGDDSLGARALWGDCFVLVGTVQLAKCLPFLSITLLSPNGQRGSEAAQHTIRCVVCKRELGLYDAHGYHCFCVATSVSSGQSASSSEGWEYTAVWTMSAKLVCCLQVSAGSCLQVGALPDHRLPSEIQQVQVFILAHAGRSLG